MQNWVHLCSSQPALIEAEIMKSGVTIIAAEERNARSIPDQEIRHMASLTWRAVSAGRRRNGVYKLLFTTSTDADWQGEDGQFPYRCLKIRVTTQHLYGCRSILKPAKT
jgi:hypothetical protein